MFSTLWRSEPAPEDDAQAASLLARHPVHIVFKHSPTCGVSAIARAEMHRYAQRPDTLPVEVVDVIGQRRLSKALAHRTEVRHESPQVLLVRDGTVVWHASHWQVTFENVVRATHPVEPDGQSAA
jgi:bacillithiol system protein YtxJ